MIKLLFIVAPSIEFEDFVNPRGNVRAVRKKNHDYGSVLTDMPLGVLALSAYVKKHVPVEIKLIDFNVILNKLASFAYPSFKDFFYNYLSQVKAEGDTPGIAGISALFMLSYQNVLDIAQCCRAIFGEVIIVAGGGVATNMYNEIFKDSTCFDGLAFGEGERPLLGLLKADNKLGYLEESPSWITREKLKKKQSFQYDFIENLDEIPVYDYSICQPEDYRLNSTISAYPYTDNDKKYITVMTSRGCPHHCCYCSAHTVHGRNMRFYSVSRIKEDFKYIRERYGAETIIFQDDHFMADRQRVFEIIEILRELKLTAFFPNALALYALDREILQALKSIGMEQLVMAIESGSDKVLRQIMHKPLSRSIIKRVAEICRELGIYMDANLIIGFPGETKQDIEDSRAFLKTINVNWFRIYTASPLVGSELLEICLKKNYIKGGYAKCNFKKANIETEDFSAEYIQEMAYILNLDLNFIANSDFRLGNYEIALKGFENAIKAKDDHALAYYYASQCHEKLGNFEKAQQYMSHAKMIVKENPFWRKYVEMFEIKI
jgi:radical SAM superfamily enzyme YgiQ (UPF0313 family)